MKVCTWLFDLDFIAVVYRNKITPTVSLPTLMLVQNKVQTLSHKHKCQHLPDAGLVQHAERVPTCLMAENGRPKFESDPRPNFPVVSSLICLIKLKKRQRNATTFWIKSLLICTQLKNQQQWLGREHVAWLTCTSVMGSSFLEFYNPSDTDQKHLAHKKNLTKKVLKC